MSGSFKKELFAQFARVAKALANGHRLELLEFLAQGERNVEDLARVSGLTVRNTSQHLQQLRQVGLVTSRKEGLHVYYSLTGDDVILLMQCVRGVAERHLADIKVLVDTYLTVKDALDPMPVDELLKRARKGEITVLDVRPAEEYAAGHLPGAVNIPLAELEKHLETLRNSGEVVAYCRGPHCVLAFEAVERLRSKGIEARRLQDGYPEWKAAGMPVEAN